MVKERRWTRKEYDRLIELGILHEDEPIELLAGALVVAEPQKPSRVTDYWIVNLVDGVLEVFGDPVREGRRWRYRTVAILAREASITPLAAPTARIAVADLLP